MNQKQPLPFRSTAMQDLLFTISFAPLFTPEAERYVQHIIGKIVKESSSGAQPELHGKLFGYRIRLNEAKRQGFKVKEIFSTDEDLLRIDGAIYDFDGDVGIQSVQAFVRDDSLTDVLILFMIELLPAYRGHGIGLHCAHDFFASFSFGSSLYFADCSALQFTDKVFTNTAW